MTNPSKSTQTDKQLLAADIIFQWKTNPSIRLKFGMDITRYADHRRGEDKQEIH